MCSSGMLDCRRSKKIKETWSDIEMGGKQKRRLLSSACWLKPILQREAFRFEPASQPESEFDSVEDNKELCIE